MGRIKKKKLVRDGFLGDLPESVQNRVMAIHKLVIETVNTISKDKHYKDIIETTWAKSMIDEFLTQPTDKKETGSVRVYKQGNRYSCMIQLTGHVTNNRNDIDHELFHDLIRNVHISMRSKVRRKFDMRLTCESEHGEHFEGFDVWTKQKEAKEIWELFEDKKTKDIKEFDDEYKESVGESNNTIDSIIVEFNDLPDGIKNSLHHANSIIIESVNKKINSNRYNVLRGVKVAYENFMNNLNGKLPSSVTVGDTYLRSNGSLYEGYITITPEPCSVVTTESNIYTEMENELLKEVFESVNEKLMEEDCTKQLSLVMNDCGSFFEFILIPEYAQKLFEYFEDKEVGNNTTITEAGNQNDIPEVTTDMSEAEAKRTLRTLSQKIIDETGKNNKYKVTQYTANIYANVITKSLLPKWSKGFRKLTITLDSYQSFFTFEFKVPNMTQDFVSRYIEGRESINGFIHRTPDIKIKMSPRIFHTMQNPDDAFNFFKAAIKYYNEGLVKYSEKLMASAMKMNREMKHLVSTTKLSGIVTLPMKLLFVFDDVHMNNKDTFKIPQEDINKINTFVKSIYSKYASPEKEKKQIVDDIGDLVKALRESCENDYNITQLKLFPEAVNDFFSGKMDNIINSYNEKFYSEQFDLEWLNNPRNYETRYYQEKFGVKKLKKIPSDLVAYITIETECIKDANDKMMIASYCIGKIEIVDWYIELLTVGSKKYIVPHNKPYLESVKAQLLACYKKIMDTPVKKEERPLIDIKYPAGYEG